MIHDTDFYIRSGEGAHFVKFWGPLLDALRDLGDSGTLREVCNKVSINLDLPDEFINRTLESGVEKFPNMIAFSRLYLAAAGFVESSKRGVWSLTDKGRATHLSWEEAKELHRVLNKKFQDDRKNKVASSSVTKKNAVSCEVEDVPDAISQDYRDEVHELLLGMPPSGFERLCQRLLREAGFTQVFVTGKTGDGGIDGHGTLEINPLVSFRVLFQCKRYSGSVTPSQVRDFRGAMAGRADKGIILTTGNFTAEAKREASRDGVVPIELIDGEKLVSMLEDLELGVKPVKAFEVDKGFFEEFYDAD